MKQAVTAPVFEVHTNEADWLKARERSIGGTSILNLLGIPIDGREPSGLWFEWVARNPNAWESIGQDGRDRYRELATPTGINLAARRAMEPVIQAWAEEENDLLILDPGDYCIIRHPEDDRKHCSPDGLIYDPPRNDVAVNLKSGKITGSVSKGRLVTSAEYKTVSPFARHHWSPEEPSLHALIQSCWSMHVGGWGHAWIFGQVGFGDDQSDRLSYRVEQDPNLLELMLKAYETFWKHVKEDTEPDPDGFEKTTHAIRLLYKAKPRKESRMVTLALGSHEGLTLGLKAMELDLIKKRTDEDARRRSQLRQEVEVLMGHLEADELIYSDEEKSIKFVRQEITNKNGKIYTRLDGPKEIT